MRGDFLATECNLAGVRFKEVCPPVIFMETIVMTLGMGILYVALCIGLGLA